MDDKVRMVGVGRSIIPARVDPTWASPGHPSPLSVPSRPCLPGSPASGTARVPAPPWKRRAVRRVRTRPRHGSSASASTSLLSRPAMSHGTAAEFDMLLYTCPHPPVKHGGAGCKDLPDPPQTSGDRRPPLGRGLTGGPGEGILGSRRPPEPLPRWADYGRGMGCLRPRAARALCLLL